MLCQLGYYDQQFVSAGYSCNMLSICTFTVNRMSLN